MPDQPMNLTPGCTMCEHNAETLGVEMPTADEHPRWFAVKFVWDRHNECDLVNGFDRGGEERLNSFKVGPVVILWGREEW